ncbi:hypothetical protein [Methylobacterium oxalidis]|uniref:Uncharacterized protein n=1 Tax=Methylobacterium oxalidis TaxID=944322 RepID=A0A512IYJ6_9HYPH|nr:hypothetical protein [Methylobacterium oxalidis]GEP02782.1 hypothetical protein MOX02_08200 [Methylobacterium oxalidis]GLS66818.1 hypothetical protein GCM10007888_52010 [Methylobacterium oxalidis]
MVRPQVGRTAPSLRACAAPGRYAQASDGPAIDAAPARLFDQLALRPQITE